MTGTSLHVLHGAEARRSTATPRGICTAHFGTLREPLLEFIENSEVVVGCVAWITDRSILEALGRRRVALVVQKENWWKKSDARGRALAQRYGSLSGGLSARDFPDPLGRKSVRGKTMPRDGVLPPIACVGYGAGSQYQPLMHHKFIVRCIHKDGALVPVAVWTGSFNFSSNANESLENAVEIHDTTIAMSYLQEFALVASVSEGMNWRLARPVPKGVAPAFVIPPTQAAVRTTRRSRSTGKKPRPVTAKSASAKRSQPTRRAA